MSGSPSPLYIQNIESQLVTLKAENAALMAALVLISEADAVDLALDPQWPKRIAAGAVRLDALEAENAALLVERNELFRIALDAGCKAVVIQDRIDAAIDAAKEQR